MSQPLGSLEGEPLPRLPQGAARCRKGRRATARRAAAAGRAAAEGRAAGAAGAGSQGLMPPTGEQPDTCEKDIQGQSCSHARAHAGARGAAPGDAGKHAADRAVCEARRRASEPSRGRRAARADTAGPDGRCCCCAPGMYVTRASRQPRRRCTRGGKGGMITRRGGHAWAWELERAGGTTLRGGLLRLSVPCPYLPVCGVPCPRAASRLLPRGAARAAQGL